MKRRNKQLYSNNDFINALESNKKVHIITAHFENGKKVEYTTNIFLDFF